MKRSFIECRGRERGDSEVRLLAKIPITDETHEEVIALMARIRHVAEVSGVTEASVERVEEESP